MEKKVISLVGAGYKGGQPIFGVEDGPKVLREGGIIKSIEELGYDVFDGGDIVFPPFQPENDPIIKDNEIGFMKNPRTVGNACKTIYETISKQSLNGNFCLTLGGDHSLAMGSISGVHAGNEGLVVIWVDAHADINTPKTSDSGNIHGMPVSFLMGLIDPKKVPGYEWLTPCLTPDRIVYIGLRDVDSGEKKILKEHGIKAFSMTEVTKYGIGQVMEMAIKHVNPNGDKPIHLTYDVDGIDPELVPSTGTRVNGGLTYREARYICEAIASTGKLVGMDVVEVNPSLGNQEDVQKTVKISIDLVKCALGDSLL